MNWRGLLFAIVGATAALPVQADLVEHSFKWALNPDGTLDGSYPAGGKPPGIDALSWDLSNALALAGFDDLTVGVETCYDVRNGESQPPGPHLLGTDAAVATIAILPVSGDDPEASGLVPPGAGDNLCWADTGVASAGQFRLVATAPSGSAQTTVKSWTATGGASVPGQVTGVSAAVNSNTAITISWTATPGADSYKAKRNGGVIASALPCCSYQHTGLTAATSYTFSMIGTNGAGDGLESSEVQATTTGSGGAFDPGYPRTWCRQCMSNMNVLNVQGSLSDFNIAADHIAKFHSGMFTGSRGTTFGGGSYHVGNYINRIKSSANYNASVGSAFVKYTNVTQISSPTGSSDAAMTFIRAKAESESVGNCGSWAMMENDCTTHRQGKTTVWEMNFNEWGTGGIHAGDPDAENGFTWAEWYPHFWYAAPVGTNDNLADSDYTMTSGHGISEGQWDGIFTDDQSIKTGQGSTVSGADQDGDGTSANNDKNDPDVVTARSTGFALTQNTWRNVLFPLHPAGTLKYTTGNITAIALQTDCWPANMRVVYNGGLVEEWTGKSKGQGWGGFDQDDGPTCNPVQKYYGMRGNYRRTMENTISPRVAAFGHENGTPVGGGGFVSEFRTKWGCKPGSLAQICSNQTKNQGWICESGTCTGSGTTCTGAGCKYVGHAADMNDFRLANWATSAVTVLGDGFISVNQNSPTWNTGIPWFEIWVGGEQIDTPGWLGQPVSGSKGDPQLEPCLDCNGVHIRYFENGVMISNPPRLTPNVVQTKTVPLDAAGVGKRWKRLCARANGMSTDGKPGTPNYSGQQERSVNDGTWVGAENTATTISIREIEGIALWRAPAGTTLACPS
jgi:hypothetical protein